MLPKNPSNKLNKFLRSNFKLNWNQKMQRKWPFHDIFYRFSGIGGVISEFHLLHMVRHLLWTDVVHVDLFVSCQLNSFINTFLEFDLVEMHRIHVELHISLRVTDTFIILIEGCPLEALHLFLLFGLQETSANTSVHKIQPKDFGCWFPHKVLEHDDVRLS